MLQVHVVLPSGKWKCLSIAESSKVGDLKCLAQKSFEQGSLFGLLLQLVRVLLDPTESLQSAGIQDGDHISAIALQAKVAATQKAFAWFCGDEIITWGDSQEGGGSKFNRNSGM